MHRGGYVLLDTDGIPDVVLIGTGSEVQLAVAGARRCWPPTGIAARVVSMPCREWFDEQETSYRETVIPPHREGAGLGRGRHRAWAGARSSATTAASCRSSTTAPRADYERIYSEYGITAEAVAGRAATASPRVRA